MDEHIQELLKELRSEQKLIRESQIRTEVDLRFHIERTNKLEELIRLHEAKSEKNIEVIDAKVGKIEIPYKVSLFLLASAGLILLVQQIIALTK